MFGMICLLLTFKSFTELLRHSTRVSKNLCILVLVSYKPVSHKTACIDNSKTDRLRFLFQDAFSDAFSGHLSGCFARLCF